MYQSGRWKKMRHFFIRSRLQQGGKNWAYCFSADILTGGLWEVASTPIEAMADGTEVKVEVFYDADDTVERVNVIQGNDAMKGVTSIKQRQRQKPAVPLQTNNSN